MSRRCSLQTVLVVLVTSVAANHEGAYCDCSTQGRWQPLFKPSQILHSEFPEHKYSDSTGGPRPTKLKVKILPHLVVPLINPLAISIQQHRDKEHEYDELNGNSIEDSADRDKKNKNKQKDEHFHYSYPYYKAPSYDEESTSSHRPYDDGHSVEEHYHNDSHEQVDHYNDPPHHHEDNAEDVSTEAGNASAEDTYTKGYDPTGSSGPGPDPTSSTVDDYYGDSYHYNNNNDESSTPSPYYNSEEHKEPVYDSSKYMPIYNSHKGYIHKDIKAGGSKKHIYRDVSNYYGSNTRGKSLRYPSSVNSHSPDGSHKKLPSHKYKSHKRVKRPPKALRSSRPIPATLHSDLYHPPPPAPHPSQPSPSVASPTPTRVAPDRAPIYHAHPPLAIITPLKLILREEANRITLLRPPAPGIHHTWSFDTPLSSRSNEIALLKKPRVLYVMKTVPHDSLSLIK